MFLSLFPLHTTQKMFLFLILFRVNCLLRLVVVPSSERYENTWKYWGKKKTRESVESKLKWKQRRKIICATSVSTLTCSVCCWLILLILLLHLPSADGSFSQVPPSTSWWLHSRFVEDTFIKSTSTSPLFSRWAAAIGCCWWISSARCPFIELCVWSETRLLLSFLLPLRLILFFSRRSYNAHETS